MTASPASSPSALAPLALRSVRERLDAPELERLLAQRDVDWQVVDQIEALRVRVDRGLAILRDRNAAAMRRAASIQTRALAGAGVCAAFAVLAFTLEPLSRGLIISAVAAAAVVSVRYWLLARSDRDALRALESRCARDIASIVTISELRDASAAIFAAFRTLVPER